MSTDDDGTKEPGPSFEGRFAASAILLFYPPVAHGKSLYRCDIKQGRRLLSRLTDACLIAEPLIRYG